MRSWVGAVSVRLLLGRAWLPVAGIVLALIVGEGLLRLVMVLLPAELQQRLQASPSNSAVSHPYIGHLPRPNSARVISGRDFRAVHRIDSRGFRNAGPWPERADIVAVGDSMTLGYGVEDDQSWPAILAQALAQSRVINLGLTGAGPQQYSRVYETIGVGLCPRILLVGLFVRNDFWDADLFDRWLTSGVGGSYMVWRDFGRPLKIAGTKSALEWRLSLLARESYLFNLLHEGRRNEKGSQLFEPAILQLADGSQLQLMPNDFASKTTGAQPDRREFRLVLDALQQIQAIATRHGTHTLVIFQPSKEEVYLPSLGGAPPDPSGPLREALTRVGIEYVDVIPVFRQHAAAGERLFFEVDGHPNAAGYALIAATVLSYLKDHGERYALEAFQRNLSQVQP
jgi:lysophospholipase L1-like esterase